MRSGAKTRAVSLAAVTLAVSFLPGACGLFYKQHSAVVYLSLAQGVLYTGFAILLLNAVGAMPQRDSSRLLRLFIALGIAMRACLLFAPPHSTDVYRYVWDGRVQANGINPYRYVPADPDLESLRDRAVYDGINRKTYAHTIYPPMAQAVFLLASRLGETVTAMKAVLTLFEALIVWCLIKLLAASGLPIVMVGLYLLHPLPVWEIAGSGHVDVIAVAFAVLALFLAYRRRQGLAGAALAAGTLAKYFPLVLAPAIYRRWGWKMPAAFALAAATLYTPYISEGRHVLGFLGGYAQEEIAGGQGIYLVALLGDAGFGALAKPLFLTLAAGILISLAWASGFRVDPSKPDLKGAFRILTAVTVLFSPHFAWYFLWLTPFLCLFPSPAVFWLTLSAPLLYRMGWPPGVLGMSVLYIPFAILLLIEHFKPLTILEATHERAAA